MDLVATVVRFKRWFREGNKFADRIYIQSHLPLPLADSGHNPQWARDVYELKWVPVPWTKNQYKLWAVGLNNEQG